MSRIFRQKISFVRPKKLREDKTAIQLIYTPGAPSRFQFESGEMAESVCLHCPDAPCMNFSEEELGEMALSEFPQYIDTSVCATNALSWSEKVGVPEVDQSQCIKCGVCASRCPVGAIYFEVDGVQINTSSANYLTDVDGEEPEEITEVFQLERKKVHNVPKTGNFLVESDEEIADMYEKLASLKVDAQFPNLLTRNLLMVNGVGCAIRRKGDNNLRMDAVLNLKPQIGVLEIEFDANTLLDSPRNILDDIAVLKSRYQVSDSKDVVPLIVSLSLPNARSEYWRVIKDIGDVLGAEINSLTIGSLMILVWNRKTISDLKGDFYATSDSMSIRGAMERKLGRPINITVGTASVMEAGK